uniref:hypothetical protein n=1 Tax=Corynebacterium glutamicum TaxID=1718 RepID=UPI00030C5B9E|nr:hypothetical protein [Corynebacterium glutamicum]
MSTFDPVNLNHYSAKELEGFTVEGYKIPPAVYTAAVQRDSQLTEENKAMARLNKILATAEAKRLEQRDKHRPELQEALEAVEQARDEAAALLRESNRAQYAYGTAFAKQQAAYNTLMSIVDDHFTDPSNPEKSDPDHHVSRMQGLVINGEQYPPFNSVALAKRAVQARN